MAGASSQSGMKAALILIGKRFASSLLTLLMVSVTIFIIAQLLPGDAAQEGTTDPAVVEAGLARSETVLDVLERFGAEGDVLGGERITLADLHAAPMRAYFMATAPGREAVAARPHLAARVAAMRQRPSVSQTRPAEAAW